MGRVRRAPADDGSRSGDREPPEVVLEMDPGDTGDGGAGEDGEAAGGNRADSAGETVGGAADRNRVLRWGERLSGLPLRTRVGIGVVVAALLAGGLALRIAREPAATPALRLRVAAASFAPALEGDGLTLSVALRNDAAAPVVVYRSEVAVDGLRAGRTSDWPLAAVGAGQTVVYGFSLPFDCEAGADSRPARLTVLATGRDRVRREVELPFGESPWGPYSGIRQRYCAAPAAADLRITYAGTRDPVDPVRHVVRLVLGVENQGPEAVAVVGVRGGEGDAAAGVRMAGENVPTRVGADSSGLLLVNYTAVDCGRAGRGYAVPVVLVDLERDGSDAGSGSGPRRVEVQVPIPAKVLSEGVRQACG